jgi:hypothetical protein
MTKIKDKYKTSKLSLGIDYLPDDFPDCFRESHVQETVSFVENEELNLLEGEFSTAQEVLDSAGSADQNVTT